jgi:hypothetical protein
LLFLSGEDIVDVENCEEDGEDENVGRVDLNDPWWRDKISDDEDIFDADVDDIDGRARPSKTKLNGSNVVECREKEQHMDERGVEEGDDSRHVEPGEHENGEGEGGDNDRSGSDDNEEGEDAVNQNEGGSSGCNFKTYFENDDGEDDDDDDDDNSEMGRSDILESPVINDEDYEIQSARTLDFHAVDLHDPTIKLEMKFSNIKMFREAVRVYNLKKGNDILFKKNETTRCVVVCSGVQGYQM